MSTLHFIILMLIAAAFSTAFHFYAKKKLGIHKPGWRYKPVNSTQRWLEIVLLISYLIALIYFPTEYMIILFFLLLSSFRAFMEWKYEPEEKQYIYNLFGTCLFLVIFIYMCIFF
ncbi:DUF4181 domain-containing protein [Bacillus atrophaeus]|uniref:DUF4181 domain-containing protein n=1 Tax=Bacillus atrophaeus TaxID=1452 RepID=UPI00032E1CD2|nr:DUF4181 domain-containing protein [Bacillus atrophaeus]AKL86600.1 YwrE [Bacillus atrophaeus UCMB-5137]PRS08670.1 DUF4181 domain-containing protein [Bacillus atrophaeus]QUF64976.1 DUF4181 domain-containing protein [Bacillus atrophaeus]WFE13805.1 DUF4181 domain-containing protein [Bacillus atrophaeus]